MSFARVRDGVTRGIYKLVFIGIISSWRLSWLRRLFLGIDGGGTTSRARLTDEAGRLLGEGRCRLLQSDAWASMSRIGSILLADAPARWPPPASAMAACGGSLPASASPAPISPRSRRRCSPVPFPSPPSRSPRMRSSPALARYGGEDGAILIIGTGTQGLAFVDGNATTDRRLGLRSLRRGFGCHARPRRDPRRHAHRRRIWGRRAGLTDAMLAALLRPTLGGAPMGARRPRRATMAASRRSSSSTTRRAIPWRRACSADSAGAIAGCSIGCSVLGATPHRADGRARGAPPAASAAALDPVLVEPAGDAMDGALALARRGACHDDAAMSRVAAILGACRFGGYDPTPLYLRVQDRSEPPSRAALSSRSTPCRASATSPRRFTSRASRCARRSPGSSSRAFHASARAQARLSRHRRSGSSSAFPPHLLLRGHAPARPGADLGWLGRRSRSPPPQRGDAAVALAER